MGELIIPKTFVNLNRPLIFLAGPVRGAPNWQDEAVEFILSNDPDMTLATPRRGIREEIAPYVVSGEENHFKRQRAWERHYLDYASKNGCIMFWLPGETDHKCEKSYVAMTRVELGQWMTRYNLDHSVRWCIGTDGNFSEFKTIEVDLDIDAPDVDVFGSLEETCLEAIRIARSSPSSSTRTHCQNQTCQYQKA